MGAHNGVVHGCAHMTRAPVTPIDRAEIFGNKIHPIRTRQPFQFVDHQLIDEFFHTFVVSVSNKIECLRSTDAHEVDIGSLYIGLLRL
jgi:hypothetical protein